MFHTSHYDYMCIQSCSPRRHHAERKGSRLSAARRVCGIHLPISILVDLCFQRKSMQFSAKILWQTQIISNHPIIFFDSERGGYTFTLSMSNNGYWWDIQLVIFNHEILWYSATIRMMVFRMATGCLKSWHPPKHFPCTQISISVAKKTFMTCILWYAYDHYLQLLLAVGHDMTWFNCDSIDSMYVLCIPACRPGSAWHRSPRRSAQRWKRVRHVRSDEANSLKVVTLTNMNIYIYTIHTYIFFKHFHSSQKDSRSNVISHISDENAVYCRMFTSFFFNEFHVSVVLVGEKYIWNIVKKQLKQGIGKKTCWGPGAAWTRAPSVRWARRIITLILSSRFLRNISHP